MPLFSDPFGTRAAYDRRDAAASRDAHVRKGQASDEETGLTADPHPKTEEHSMSGEYLKSAIFGGMDGAITTFAVVAAAQGGAVGSRETLVLGLASLVADAVSMAVGDFISTRSEMDYQRSELKRETWEFENYPDGEKQEMIDLYTKKGISTEDATTVINILSKYPKFFVDHMLVEELGMLPPDQEVTAACRSPVIMFFSFFFCGLVPLAAYVAIDAGLSSDQRTIAFAASCVCVLLTLFGLGAAKGYVARQSLIRSGAFVMMNGAAAAALSYGIGFLVEKGVGTSFD